MSSRPESQRMAGERPSSKGQAWFCTTGLPSDVVVDVDEMSFHLHKFPLMSKSGKLRQLITEREQNPRPREDDGDGEIEEEELHQIALPDFPGGADAFEAAAKFCYGVKIDLTASTAAALRCAAEYLAMTEDLAEDNLVARTDRFLSQSVLRSLRYSIKALKSCESLLPIAEDLGIVQRLIDAVAVKACASDPSSLLGWQVNDGSSRRGRPADSSWLDDLTVLSLPTYKRLISAMKERNPSADVIEGSLISYARRSIPGLSRSIRMAGGAPAPETEQRELLETLITNLPLEKGSGVTSTRFLFRLLRTINILRASEDSRAAMERKIASQLESATVDDFLMPSYSYLAETLYDVESVERILGFYLENLGESSAINDPEEGGLERVASLGGENTDPPSLTAVGKLVDGYLAEIASDANLKADKFCDLALALPEHARHFDDGLYRAIDLYLKAHPGITEEEREKVCGVMDCRKLTLEACTHAAQNERLPVRAVVQVLFFEQLQLRCAIAGTLVHAGGASEERHTVGEPRERDTWQAAARQNQVLRLDMDSMTSRVQELERECSMMRKAIEKVDRRVARRGPAAAAAAGRRFGCRFGTKVCDSHQRTVVEPRRSPKEHSQ